MPPAAIDTFPPELREFCRVMRHGGRDLLPTGLSQTAARRVLAAAIAGGTREQLAAAAGDEEILDGYTRRPASRWTGYDTLRRLVIFARRERDLAGSQIAELTARRDELKRILEV